MNDHTPRNEPTLRDLRVRLHALATDEGSFAVVCARSGERPVPIDDLSFSDRRAAREGACLATQYRSRLRRYDPRVARHDLVVTDRDSLLDGRLGPTTARRERRCSSDPQRSTDRETGADRGADARHSTRSDDRGDTDPGSDDRRRSWQGRFGTIAEREPARLAADDRPSDDSTADDDR